MLELLKQFATLKEAVKLLAGLLFFMALLVFWRASSIFPQRPLTLFLALVLFLFATLSASSCCVPAWETSPGHDADGQILGMKCKKGF